MTQVETRTTNGTPLTHPVPGTWMKPPYDAPAVYVPHELEEKKVVTRLADGSEETHKVSAYIKGAHYTRLLLDGWAIVGGPGDVVEQPRVDVEALLAANEAMRAEMAELRAQIERDREATTTTRKH